MHLWDGFQRQEFSHKIQTKFGKYFLGEYFTNDSQIILNIEELHAILFAMKNYKNRELFSNIGAFDIK